MKAITTKRIISTINALFFTLLIIFVITIASLLLWLKQGIYFDQITLFEHKISRLYIKWDKKITLKAQSIEKLYTSKNKNIKIPNLDLILRIVYNTVDKINIRALKMDNFEGKLEYFDQQLLIKSNQFDLKTDYTITPTLIHTNTLKLLLHKLNLSVAGNASISKKDDTIYLDTKLIMADDANGTLQARYTNETLYLDITSETFKKIDFIKKFLFIPENITPWIFDKLYADSFKIDKLSSHFSFDKENEFLLNLEVTGEIENFSYQFADKLYPITAEKAKVHYLYGSLEILPFKPKYNQKNMDGSKVALLYLLNKPTLSLSLKTKETLDQEIIDILNNYKVPVPVVQKSGTSDSKTDLLVDLRTGKTQYDARIHFNKSHILLGGFNLFVDTSNVRIKDNQLTISHTELDDESLLQGSVEGAIDLKEGVGNIDVNIESMDLSLVKTRNPFKFQILFQKDATILQTQDSNWALLNGYNFSLLNRQYTLTKDLKLEIPSTHFYDPKRLDISLSGYIDFKQSTYDVTLLVNNLILSQDENNKTMHLLHPVKFKSNPKKLGSFENDRPLIISNGKDTISVDKVSLISNKKITLNMDKVQYKENVKTDIDAHYDPKTGKGSFDFNNLNVDFNNTDPSYLQFHKEKLSFLIDSNEELRIYSPQLQSGYKRQKESHIFHIDDVSAVTDLSPFLKNIHNKKGKILVKTEDFKTFTLFSKLKDFDVDGFINDRVDNSIDVIGTITKEGLKATINDNISVNLGKEIFITMENAGFDLQPLFKEDNKSHSEPMTTPIKVTGKNGFLVLGDKNQIIYEAFQAHTQGDSFYANVKHKEGQAILFSEKKRLELFGEKFGDIFISNLIGFDGFKNGAYSFYLKGDNNLTLGGIHVENAIAKDFALYNNLLAYFNTIPALLTFQSPGFNSEGFVVNKGDIGFEKSADKITIKSLKLFGRTSNIFGNGTVNLTTKQIDITLRIFLLKDMGSIISNIPIAGYLLLGDDGSLTTTISVTGTYSKPEISVNLAKDIFMAPINIIKRTFSLPGKLLHWLTGDDDKKEN